MISLGESKYAPKIFRQELKVTTPIISFQLLIDLHV